MIDLAYRPRFKLTYINVPTSTLLNFSNAYTGAGR